MKSNYMSSVSYNLRYHPAFFLLSFPTLCANRRRQAGTERAIQVLSARPRGDSDGDDGVSALSEFSVHF